MVYVYMCWAYIILLWVIKGQRAVLISFPIAGLMRTSYVEHDTLLFIRRELEDAEPKQETKIQRSPINKWKWSENAVECLRLWVTLAYDRTKIMHIMKQYENRLLLCYLWSDDFRWKTTKLMHVKTIPNGRMDALINKCEKKTTIKLLYKLLQFMWQVWWHGRLFNSYYYYVLLSYKSACA